MTETIHEIETTVTYLETPVTVYFTYTPGTPGRMYLNNGDPGDPPEGAEVYIKSILDDDGEDYYGKITSEEYKRICDECIAYMED